MPRGPALPFEGAEVSEPASKKPLAGTALALDLPAGPALPFVEGEAPPEVAEAAPREEPSPAKKLGATALAVDVPRGPALPFAAPADAEVKPAEVESPTKTKRFAKLSLGMELPRDLFAGMPQPTAAPGAPIVGAQTNSPAAPDPGPPSAVAPQSASAPASLLTPAPPSALAATSVLAPAPAEPAAPLTLEQHASLCVELAATPERAAEIFARYRVTPAQKEQTEAYFRDRFAREPALREAWNRAYATYRDWLAAQPRRP
ncbi:MAG: hypothetical protein QM820_26300 [Minicystis sp.]